MPNSLGATRFLAFGDSITYGTLSSYDGSFLYDVPGWSYSVRLKLALDAYHAGTAPPPRTYTVVNAGQPAEAASDGARRIQSVITSSRPQALLLLEGINDLGGAGRSVSETVSSLLSIVNTARANNATVLIATMFQTYETTNPTTGEYRENARDLVVPFNNQIRATFNGRQNVHIVDLYGPFGTGHRYVGADGLHPNEDGYQLMASTFLLAIERVFAVQGSFQ
jgi:lysophospholipase L1-like esterase